MTEAPRRLEQSQIAVKVQGIRRAVAFPRYKFVCYAIEIAITQPLKIAERHEGSSLLLDDMRDELSFSHGS
jgi:hypothetical protein